VPILHFLAESIVFMLIHSAVAPAVASVVLTFTQHVSSTAVETIDCVHIYRYFTRASGVVTRLLRAALLAVCIFAWLRVPTGTKPL
jgi:hypothetical protein